MVFRNIAFYRYPAFVDPSERLRDFGFEIVPAFSPEMHKWGDRPKQCLGVSLWFMIIYSFCCNVKGYERPHFVNIYMRLMEPKAFGHVLRFFTFVGTTLPGAADHCFGDFHEFESPKPTTLTEVFFTRWPHGSPGNNCGDLVFSGHIFETWLMLLILYKYA